MKICMLSYSFYESDTRILQYASALADRGDRVDVIALRRKGSPKFEMLDGVGVYRIQQREVNEQGRIAYLVRIIKFFFLAFIFLTRKYMSRRYDVVHVHSVPDFLVFTALVPKLLGARLILDIHDILPEFYASKFHTSTDSVLFKMLVLLERISVRFADHVIIANHIWQERLIHRSLEPGKCTTILNYPSEKIFRPCAARRNDGRFRIIYPGSLNVHQGLDVALRAFAKCAADVPNAEFHIYGEGPAKASLVELRDQLRLQDRVFFYDFLPTPTIAAIMAESDLAIVPKRASCSFGNEAVSTKVMEFMQLGVPLIVSRTKVDTFYHDDSLVKFFESENVDDLAQCIRQLWADQGLRVRLAANAYKFACDNGWHERKHDYLRVIDGFFAPAAPLQNCIN